MFNLTFKKTIKCLKIILLLEDRQIVLNNYKNIDNIEKFAVHEFIHLKT